MLLASFPSPSQGVWHLGSLPIRAYALCIIVGIFAAITIGERRWIARGGLPGTIADVAVWAVPLGVVGGRLYHVITTPERYFGSGGHPLKAFAVWEGGLGIWGAVALGALGAWIGCRQRGIPLPPFADALAPGLLVAQALGRFGNYFNQELFGRPTDLPWALRIDPQHRPAGYGDATTFHPTFLYESLWNVGIALLIVWADRRWRLGHGRVFALYVAGYTAGRGWIEALRIDDAHHVLGLRLNDWTSLVLFVAAVAYFVLSSRLRPGREEVVDPRALTVDDGAPAAGEPRDNGVEHANQQPADVTPDGAASPDPKE